MDSLMLIDWNRGVFFQNFEFDPHPQQLDRGGQLGKAGNFFLIRHRKGNKIELQIL